MSGQKISSFDVDTYFDGISLNVESATLTIDDKTAPQSSRGRPDGYTQGDVSAAGELEVDSNTLEIIMAVALRYGSFQAMPAFDVLMFAKTPDSRLRVEAYGCKFRVSDLINLSNSSPDKLKHKLPFDVTSPDFVRINGVAYAEARGALFSISATVAL